jgi:SpoVK/Ycf46/Vps4 family AAA+-type ATPase
VKISDIKHKYVGESEKRVREVFELARQHDQAIIFFDEIDALAGERSDSQAGHERSLLNELLIQMDGLESKQSESSILILGATNTPWNVDMALRRDKRLGTVIFIPHPDRWARKQMLASEMKDRPCDVDIDCWLTGRRGLSVPRLRRSVTKRARFLSWRRLQKRNAAGRSPCRTSRQSLKGRNQSFAGGTQWQCSRF